MSQLLKHEHSDAAGPLLKRSKHILVLAALILISVALFLVFTNSSKQLRDAAFAPLSQMPTFVQSAPPNVQEAYQFAVANPELLEQMPCYCGCGGIGHDDNIDCYVKAFNPDGSVAEFENHAAL